MLIKKVVFLSSTSRDLKEYRDAAYSAIEELDGYHCVRMEDFGARHKNPYDFCCDKVGECDLFVGIIGHLYGSCPKGGKKSYTEMEYEAALFKQIPCLMFFAPEYFPVPNNLIEPDEKRKKQGEFRQRVSRDCIRSGFTSPDNLAFKIIQAIRNWEQQTLTIHIPIRKNVEYDEEEVSHVSVERSPVENIKANDLMIMITKPQGFNMFGKNRFIPDFSNWLSNPIGVGDDPSSREYEIQGEVLPHVLGLIVDIKIHTNKWWPQSKCFVDSEGRFSGSVWIHRSLPPAIIRFDILDGSSGELLKRFDVQVS